MPVCLKGFRIKTVKKKKHRPGERLLLGLAILLCVCAPDPGVGGAGCCFKSLFSFVLCLGRTHMSGMRLKTALSPQLIITWQVVEPTLFSHFSSFSSPPSNFPLHPRVGISEPQPVNVSWLTHLESNPLHHCPATEEEKQWEEAHEKPREKEHSLFQKTNAHSTSNFHRNMKTHVNFVNFSSYLLVQVH